MYTLKELSEKVKAYFEAESFMGKPEHLYEPIAYTMKQSGKRIRPTMLLAATQLFGGDVEQARFAAIGIETFHNFTLLHDDLMDRSPMRRGMPTVYRKWDENRAILSGDAMEIMALHYFLLLPHKNIQQILQTFERTGMEICEGQQYDMDFEHRDDVSISEYMEMIRLKTAVLLGGALKMGALYADASVAEQEAIYRFGIDLGLAFQLRDDYLDAWGDPKTFGKQTGTDIKDNKKTYLVLRALEKGNATQRQRLLNLFHNTPDDPTEKIAEVMQIYEALEIKKDVEHEVERYSEEALQHLASIERQEEAKKPLQDLAQTMMAREK